MSNVHFVGSVALDTPEDVFAAIGQHCGPYLKRVPDGEPGGRRLWISWQIPVLRANPSLVQVGQGQFPLKLAEGVKPDQIHFGELGYAREARPSYEDFLAARAAGHIPTSVRFQVSLPTPLAVVMPFCQQPDAQQIYPPYERAMFREVERICKAIPHHDLAIQWDVCIEMLAWDGRWENARSFPGMEQVFSANFARLGHAVPPDVELGFHLCYGDLDAKHFVEPIDATKMVEMANLIARSVPRSVTWMHMPVPIDRTDDAFFAPLKNLQLGPGTELYLGLVHAKDGVEGTKKRIAVAKKYVQNFGIASECGISRGRDPNLALEFIKTYAGAAATFVLLFILLHANLYGQRGGPPQPPASPKAAAPTDLTGYWASLVTEDWRFRMATPPKGDFTGVPLNPAGRKLAEAWDPARDEAAGDRCKAYGAGGIVRMPGRIHITWQDDQTLKLETDAGTQTRTLAFGAPAGQGGDWQGVSIASWDRSSSVMGAGFFGPAPPKGGSLKVITSKMKPGYLRKNGVPYSADAVMTEYFDRFDLPNGDSLLVVSTEFVDTTYLTQPFWTSTHFKKQNDAAGWNPTPCSAR